MKIARIDAWPLRIPRDIGGATGTAGSPTLLAAGTADYRWSSVYPALYSIHFETAVVRVTMSDGTVGWGEAQAPLAPEVACGIVRLLLDPAIRDTPFEGTRPEIEALWDRMYSTMRVRGQTGGFMMDAIAAVDTALWDIAGKMAGKPVSALLAAAPKRRIPAYVSGLPQEKRAEAASRYMAEGFRKFKLFFDTAEQTEFLRGLDAMPTGAQVAVDALWRLRPENAVRFGRELDARRALWLEAPLLPEDPAAHGSLARQIATPVAIGESYRTRFEMAPFFREQALRILQPDLGRCGITEGLRLAQLAETFGVIVVPHISIAFGPQIAAALHYAAAVANCGLTEYNPQVLSVANRFLEVPLSMDGDGYAVPQGPGLGIALHQDALA